MERGHLPLRSNHCPATNGKGTLGGDALVTRARMHQSLGIDGVTCRREEQSSEMARGSFLIAGRELPSARVREEEPRAEGEWRRCQ